MNSIKNIALVTGGSSGIGKAIALELASRKYDLVLVSNQELELANSKLEIEKQYRNKCYTLNTDLSLPTAAEKVYNYCIDNNLQISFLVNNAGILLFSNVHEASTKKVETILQLHINTPTLLCKFFAKDMVARKSGYILNVSSISSVMPYPCISLYGPTKTFMRYFSQAMRVELQPHQVKLCCLIPGATATSLYDPSKVNLNLALKTGIMSQADFVAKKAIQDTLKNRGESIPGFMNKLTVWVVPLLPNFIIPLIYSRTKWVDKLWKMLN